MPVTLIGTSGATVVIGPKHVVKFGSGAVGKRVVLQGLMMKEIGHLAFPRVLEFIENGYVMEQLMPVDWTRVTLLEGLRHTRALLNCYVWVRPPLYAPEPGPHHDYVRKLAEQYVPYLVGYLRWWAEQAVFGEERRHRVTLNRTHGDPTADNLMRTTGGGFILTDPLPSSRKMPDVRAVDLGKMLQSAYGYERVKYPDRHTMSKMQVRDCIDVVLHGERPEDKYAAYYFCAVHFLRLLPYQPAELRPHFIQILQMIVDEHA